MRFGLTPIWLPLGLLLALPMLNAGSRVEAAYVGAVSVKPVNAASPGDCRLRAATLGTDLYLTVDETEGAQNEPLESDAGQVDPGTDSQLRARLAKLRPHLNEPSSAGTGAGVPGGSSVAPAGLADKPETPTSELVARLYADDRIIYPPPLGSGLFRPPRQSA
jgi:hypothetical protein